MKKYTVTHGQEDEGGMFLRVTLSFYSLAMCAYLGVFVEARKLEKRLCVCGGGLIPYKNESREEKYCNWKGFCFCFLGFIFSLYVLTACI